MLEIRLSGKFEVKRDGKPITISSRIAQSLFAYLVISAGTSHRREKLAGMFWPDLPEEKARAYLRHEIWRVRKALCGGSTTDYVQADNIGISFDSSANYWLDVNPMKQLNGASTIIESADALLHYRGEVLPGFYDDWVIAEREQVQAIYEQAISRMLKSLEDEERWSEILAWGERWISFSPGAESAYRYLMIAYDSLGDRARVASTYERCKAALLDLGLEPSQECRALLFKRTPKLKLPIPLTSFVGREKELQETAELVAKARLVTLTGAGGIGKTRLSIQLAGTVLERFPDGAWFVDLASTVDPDRVPDTVATVLGLIDSGNSTTPMTDRLLNYLCPRKSLIILDNCEHLVAACAFLAHTLLTSCEGLSILATSRKALRVEGEHHYRVPSLSIPAEDDELEPGLLVRNESIRLFVERAAVASPAFSLDARNAPSIAQICRMLDGIPLAIELAAARVQMFTVDKILRRLEERFTLLRSVWRTTPSRHRTLRATLEWSYDLLAEPEQTLFRRLAVFSGGWTSEAAEAVCSDDGIKHSEVLHLLEQLVNHSLVIIETVQGEVPGPKGGSLRYRALDTIREFARNKFVDVPIDQLRDKHLRYFLKKAEEIEPLLTGPDQSTWMDYLEFELHNFRAALDWSISNKMAEESLRLFGSLAWFYFIHCHFREGLQWFERVLKLRQGTSNSVQAKAIGDGSWLNYAMGDIAIASARRLESAELYRKAGDLKGLSTQLQFVGVVESERGNGVQARLFLQESLRISLSIHNRPAMPRVLLQLGLSAESAGDHATAWRYFEESLAICREVGEGHLLMMVLGTMGDLALAQGNTLQAREYYRESLEIGIRLKNKRTIAKTLLSFAELFSAEEGYAKSAQLTGFAKTLFSQSDSLTESHSSDIQRLAEVPKQHLGDDRYRQEFESGTNLRMEQAVEIALKPHA